MAGRGRSKRTGWQAGVGAKVQDGRQAQGQAAWTASCAQSQEGEKRRLGKAGAETQKLWLTSRTRRIGNRPIENTGINTQGIMGKMGDTWRGVETITKTGETDQGVTVPPSWGSIWRPTWVHTWLTGIPAVEVGDEGWVQDVASGDPAPLLWAITLPVNQVLEPPAQRSNLQETPHRDSVEGVGLETVDKGL